MRFSATSPSSTNSHAETIVAGSFRSEERRVGEEGRSRGAPDHLKKKKKEWGGARESAVKFEADAFPMPLWVHESHLLEMVCRGRGGAIGVGVMLRHQPRSDSSREFW